MARRRSTSAKTTEEPSPPSSDEKTAPATQTPPPPTKTRSTSLILSLFAVLLNCCWVIHKYQYDSLPLPLTAQQSGKRGFSEHAAMDHVEALTQFGPHPVGSDALDHALQYVFATSEKIKKTAHWEVDVQVDLFHAESGANRLTSGLFKGKTLVYSDLKHVVLKIFPKYMPEAEDNAILVSSHIDTVFSTAGAGDCSSCVAVMLELARGVSQWAQGFKHAVIFLFNTGEEEGLKGAHSFITQHPWSTSVRVAIDLEAMGVGGKSSIFQGGPDPWAIENFAKVAKYPSAQILAQDVFLSGLIKSATDFQVYKEVAGLSGLDFAYEAVTAVYHTKNDKKELLKPGSLQHLGENMLAFLLQTAALPHLPKGNEVDNTENLGQDQAVFFDILGTYMIVYRQRFANMLHSSVIVQALLIWATSLLIGGYPAAVSLGLSCLSLLFMWIFSLSFSIIVSLSLPLICSSPVPYIASPWLVVGLFGAPAVLGALVGQHVGFLFLLKYLRYLSSKRKQNGVPATEANIVQLEAERWLFKAGFIQWLVVLTVGSIYKIGSSYIALVWLVSPAFAYGFLEATLSPVRSPKPLKVVTLLLGLSVPVVFSAGIFIRLVGILIGTIIRLERSPGSSPEWVGNVMVCVVVAAIVCLTLVYLFSYVHLSGGKKAIIIICCVLFGVCLSVTLTGVVPAYTQDIARVVNVVHVVDTRGKDQSPRSYISLFSNTPGSLVKDVDHLIKEEGFSCGTSQVVDFVSFRVNYGCLSYDDVETGWSESDIPKLLVESDDTTKRGDRVTRVSIDTKASTRWTLAINMHQIQDFELQDLIPVGGGNKVGVDGWHTIQFSGGKNAPTHFILTLSWGNSTSDGDGDGDLDLVKLRTDFNKLTPKAQRVEQKLPPWFTSFGKSTNPQGLAFLATLPLHP